MSPAPWILRGRVVTWVVAAALTMPPPAYGEPTASVVPLAPDSDVSARLAELLAEPCSDWSQVPGLRTELEDLGPAALPDLLRALTTGRAVGPDGEDLEVDRYQALALRCVVELAPRQRLLAMIDEIARTSADPVECRGALELLGGVATGEDLDLVFRLARPRPLGNHATLEDDEAFRRALGALLVREPGVVSRLGASIAQVPASLRSAAVEAVASLSNQQALRTLVDALGRVPGIDPVLLVEITYLLDEGYVLDARQRIHLRSMLASGRPGTRELAIHAVARARDVEAIPSLIDLLDDLYVSHAAHGALSSFVNFHLPADGEVWREWYASEWRWWEESAERLLHALDRGRPAMACAAIAEMASHPILQEEAEQALIDALARREARVICVALSCLTRLGSAGAIEPMTGLLEHPDDEVRRMAHTGLQELTGLSLPPIRDTWNYHLDSR